MQLVFIKIRRKPVKTYKYSKKKIYNWVKTLVWDKK